MHATVNVFQTLSSVLFKVLLSPLVLSFLQGWISPFYSCLLASFCYVVRSDSLFSGYLSVLFVSGAIYLVRIYNPSTLLRTWRTCPCKDHIWFARTCGTQWNLCPLWFTVEYEAGWFRSNEVCAIEILSSRCNYRLCFQLHCCLVWSGLLLYGFLGFSTCFLPFTRKPVCCWHLTSFSLVIWFVRNMK